MVLRGGLEGKGCGGGGDVCDWGGGGGGAGGGVRAGKGSGRV